MPHFPLVHPIERSEQAIQLDLGLPRRNSDWVAWWYSGIKKNKNAESQPHALLAFRELIDGRLSLNALLREVPFTALGQMRLGSIWNGIENDGEKRWISKSRLTFEQRRFDISFIEGDWERTSFEKANPFPHDEIHLLKYPKDQNELLVFSLPSGGKLVVPCTEFFTRCYGHSGELRRTLLTYGWNEVINRCYAPLEEPDTGDVWKVRLKKRLRNADTVLLAHMKYDLYTKKRVMEINSQLQADFIIPEKLMFLRADPWFQGPAEMLCHGIPFDNDKSFLALRILGISDPDGIVIERDRENSSLRTNDGNQELNGVAWNGVKQKRIVRPPKIVELTSQLEPDHGSDEIEVIDEPFVTLGVPRLIVDRHGRRVTERNGKRVPGNESSRYSSGDPFGAGKGVGRADLHAPTTMESAGAIRDMWNAMLHLQQNHPNTIQAVEWFSFGTGYQSGPSSQLIALEPFDEFEEVEKDVRNWVFKNVKLKEIRGVLAARMTINSTQVHIIEIDRRPRKKKNSDTTSEDSEEAYRGLVCVFERNTSFPDWLTRFLSDIRYVKGRVQKLKHTAHGFADAFNHPADSLGQVRGKASVLNALSKLGISM